jgi:hypothetical protein
MDRGRIVHEGESASMSRDESDIAALMGLGEGST